MKPITQAFVLAGGRGERLRPLTDDLPKPLVNVCGKPILEYNIELLVQNGVKEIILATGYLHGKIEDYFGSGEQFNAKIIYSVEHEPLGTGGALKSAEKILDDRFIMMNGDNIANFDFIKMNKTHFEEKAKATIALVQVEDVSSYGVAKLEGKKIVEFVEKPLKENAPSNWVNAGAYVLEKDVLNYIPKGFSLIEKNAFPALAMERKLAAHMHKGYWFTTDTFERLQKAENGLKNYSTKRN
jgi:NDP-sugar pyrophosphorylase family protein